jgi:hypothetical protein
MSETSKLADPTDVLIAVGLANRVYGAFTAPADTERSRAPQNVAGVP